MATEVIETVEAEEIQKPVSSALAVSTPGYLLDKAIQAGLGIEHLERLMNLYNQHEAKLAEKAYLTAFAKFQSIVPVIEKKKKVSFNQTNYKYADLAEIQDTIKDALRECGLSFRWEFEENGNHYTCICIVSHEAGHSKTSRMTAEKDSSGNKNPIQAIGSARTYLQRYTLIAALGITTADEDNDGRKPEQYGNDKKQEKPKQEKKPEIKPEPKPEPIGRNYTAEADECMKADDPYKAFSIWWKSLSKAEGDELKKGNFLKHYQEEIKRIQEERKTNLFDNKKAERKEPEKSNEPIPAGYGIIEHLINALSAETFERDHKLIEDSIDNVPNNYARREYGFKYNKKLNEIGCKTAWGPLPF